MNAESFSLYKGVTKVVEQKCLDKVSGLNFVEGEKKKLWRRMTQCSFKGNKCGAQINTHESSDGLEH